MKANRLAVATCAALATCAIHAQTVDVKDTWNLEEIYPSTAAWKADQTKLEGQLKQLSGCAGHLGDGVARFKQCLDLRQDADKRITRMYVYAGEKFADNTGSPGNLELLLSAQLLGTRVQEVEAFMKHEIQ